jgi:hypothetical protein
MEFGSPICEKPFTSAPRKPSSFTQRVSSRVAASASCIASAASPWKRSGRLATCSARKSFARRATSTARFGSAIACTAGALSDRIIISMPWRSISAMRRSWMSMRRAWSSGQVASARKPFESASVSGMAKCSSSPILPFTVSPFSALLPGLQHRQLCLRKFHIA